MQPKPVPHKEFLSPASGQAKQRMMMYEQTMQNNNFADEASRQIINSKQREKEKNHKVKVNKKHQ